MKAFALLALAVLAGHAAAQGCAPADYPSRPVRFVPSSPGGGADLLGRMCGKPFVVENRSGAGGIIGCEIQAPADGYTSLLVAGGYTLNSSLYARLPFDTIPSPSITTN